MEIYTIGFTKKRAKEFFGILKQYGIKRLIDIRLNNQSQLAAFTKRDDLEYFLKQICGAEYSHKPVLAPTKEILNDYKKKTISWEEYEKQFLRLLNERKAENTLDKDTFEVPAVLLCSEPKADKCHRRLVAEYFKERWGDVNIIHL